MIERQYLFLWWIFKHRDNTQVEMHLALIFCSAECFVFLLCNTQRKANTFFSNL